MLSFAPLKSSNARRQSGQSCRRSRFLRGRWRPLRLEQLEGRALLTTGEFNEQVQLIATDGGAADFFGISGELSGDGNTAIVGSFLHDVGGNADQGAAYIYARSGSGWTEVAKLVAPDGAAGDFFGYPVEISTDGNTVLVGAHGRDEGGNSEQGAAYVFTRSVCAWTFESKLTAADGGAGDIFGGSVALSANGSTALVGAEGNSAAAATSAGSAYVFTRSGSAWAQTAKLTAAGGEAGDRFGVSVALNGDGTTALVGAWFDDVATVDQGSAYVFTQSGSTWTQEAQLVADGGSETFGYGVALSSDGGTALIGAHYDSVGIGFNQGSAYVFTRDGGLWAQEARLIAADGAPTDAFGGGIALSSDGNTALIGTWRDDVVANVDQGSAYVFERDGTIWTERQKLTASDGAAGDEFGIWVAMDSDATTALITAPRNDVDTTIDQGSVYVFKLDGSTLFGGDDDCGPNSLPVATDDAYSTSQAIGVAGNVITDDTGSGADSDPDDDELIVSGNTLPQHGTLVIHSDGSFTYTPESTFAGADSFSYTISDGNGHEDTALVTITVSASPISTIEDACCDGKTALLVLGTTANDHIVVEPGSNSSTLRITRNAVSSAWPKPSGRIIVMGGAGHDNIQIAGAIGNPVWLYGEAGDDRLNAGNGGGLLFGGHGNDQLHGGNGRDVMVGGDGADHLVGNSGDDILLASLTTYDDRGVAGHEHFWCEVLKEWNGTNSFNARVNNLRNGSGGTGYTGPFLLPHVVDDAMTDAVDKLNGSAGNDWLVSESDEDKVSGQSEASN